jgi:hypothetical protein
MLRYLWCVLTIQRKYRRLNNFVKKREIEKCGIVINGVSKIVVTDTITVTLRLSRAIRKVVV